MTIRAGDDLVTVALLSDADTPDVYVELSTGSAEAVLLTADEAHGLTGAIMSNASSA